MSERERGGGPREVLFEFRRIGNAVKVTAVDPDTLVEVAIIGAAAAGEEMLKRAALRKLRYMLERRPASPSSVPDPSGNSGGG